MTQKAFTFDLSAVPDTASSILAKAERRFALQSEEEDDGTLILAMRVKVSCDLSTDGLWLDGQPYRACDLPVDESIQRALLIWQEWYERHINNTYEPDPSAEDVAAFARLGFAIACAIKQSLPDWQVMFFDEDLLSEFRAVSSNRRFYPKEYRPWIYEISTEMVGDRILRPRYEE